MKKIITFLMAFGFVLLSSVGWGQYGGVGVFNKITSIDDLTNGNYVIVEANDEYAMNDVHNGTYLDRTAVTPAADAITNPAASIVWFISVDGGGRSIYSIGSEKYVSYTGSSNNVQVVDEVTTDNQRWTITYGSGVFTFTNLAVTNRILQYNAGAPRFACYTSNQRKFLLYKEDTGGPEPPAISNITQDPASNITSASSVAVSADVAAGDAAIDFVELRWGTASGVLGNTISMTGAGTYTSSTDIPAQANGTTVYYVVYAEDMDGESATSAEQSYLVRDPATTTLPYANDFSLNEFGDIYTYTVAGSKPWEIASGGAQANGFNGEATEEHWMVLPGIDLDAYEDEVMTFTTYARYGAADAANYLKLFYSADYPGLGDPTTFTWTELAFDQPAGINNTTEESSPSGSIDLSGIAGESVYIAFKYYSTDTPTRWRVDDIAIEEVQVAVTFYVDMSNEVDKFTNVDIAGSFNNWGDPVVNMTLVDDNIYSYTTNAEFAVGSEISFKFRKDGEGEPGDNRTYTVVLDDNAYHAVYGIMVPAEITYANLQWPGSGTINSGEDYNVFAQVYADQLTGDGDVPNMQAWIGYSTEDTDPAGWESGNWFVASYNPGEHGNNDEYTFNLGSELTTSGTYYYASRFKLGLADYVYGGFNGGFWDGTNNVSGVLNILNDEPDAHPTAFSAEANSASAITVSWTDASPTADGYLIKGSNVSYAAITDPVDGTAEADAVLVQNVAASNETHQFTGLDAETTYYFKIFPYNGSGSTVNYKTDLAPQDDATTTAGPGAPNVWINEIHYDNIGTDADEFIEIVLENPGDYALADFDVYLVNGNNGEIYNTKTLDLFTVGSSYGNFTVYTYTYPVNGIQNGAPDGMAIAYQGALVPGQFLSYEGTFTGVGGAVDGVLSIDIGVSEDNSTTTLGFSLQLAGAGTTYSDFSWMSQAQNTLGTINNQQSFNATTVWNGSNSTDWDFAGNWSNGLPVIGSDVTISAAVNNPVLSSEVSIGDLIIENGAILTVQVNGHLTAEGTLTNNAGNGGLIVKSDATGTGSLIHNTADVPATVERYVTGGPLGEGFRYHLLSIPMANNITAGDAFMGTYLWTFASNAAGTPEDPNWIGIQEETQELDVRHGFLGYVAETDHRYSFTGNLKTGAFTSDIATTAGGNFNLVPNPYPSAMDWDAVVTAGSNTTGTIWFFQSETGNYVSYNAGTPVGGNIIPVGQSVFVEADGASPAISFGNEVRVHNNKAFYKQAPAYAGVLHARVEANSSADNTYIRFKQDAANSYNSSDDARKLRGFAGAPQLYTYSSDLEELSINTLGNTAETLVIPMGFEVETDGEATLIFGGMDSFDANAIIHLEDVKAQRMINLSEQNTYTFMHDQAYEDVRFRLHFFGVTGTEDLVQSNNHHIWSHEDKLYIHIPDLSGEQVQLELYDLMGRQLTSKSHNLGQPSIITLPYKGIVFARIVSGNTIYTKKLIIR